MSTPRFLAVTHEETVALMHHSIDAKYGVKFFVGGTIDGRGALKVCDENFEYMLKLAEMRGMDTSKYDNKGPTETE